MLAALGVVHDCGDKTNCTVIDLLECVGFPNAEVKLLFAANVL